MKKQLFLFFASMCTVASVYAQPSISNVNGSLEHRQTVIITGSGFGSKTVASPFIWDDLSASAYSGLSHGDPVPTQEGTFGSPSDTTAPWPIQGSPSADPVTYNTTDTRVAGRPCYRVSRRGHLKGEDPGGSEVSKMYVTWWVNFSHDIVNGPGGSASTKLIRVWDSGGDNARLSWTGYHMTYEGSPSPSWENWGGTYGQWSRVELFIDNETHTIQAFTDGKLIHDVTDLGTVPSNYLNWIGLIGLDPSVPENLDPDLRADFGDIYADTEFARVELGNASTWSACTHREIQIPSAWASGSVSVTVNQGAFAPGQPVYLYVVDANGNVNSTGYPLSIAGSTHTITSSAGSGGSIAPGGTLQVSGGTDQSYTITADSGYEIEDVTVDGVSQGAVSSYTFADVQTDHTISVNFTAIGGDIIVDNGGPGTSQSGSWGSSVHYPGYYGSNYSYAPNVSGHWYEWATALSGGTYEVYAWWTAVSGRPADVIYDITHSGGTANITADQTANGGQWNLLGTYTFGSTGLVRLNSSPNGPEGACADAIKFVAVPVEENLALNKAVTVSGEPESANPGTSAVDGEETTRWSVAGAYPQWLEVDLGAVYDINATELVCYQDRAYQFTVDVKTTAGGSYTQVVDRTSNTQGGSAANPIRDDFTKVEARYVRITATGAHQYSGDWTSFREFRVFGTNASSTNSSAGTPVTIEGLSVERANREEGMKVFFNPNELEVYYSPDPAVNEKEKALVGVYDKNGQLIEQFSTDAGSLRTGVICDSSQWGEGLYIVRISTAKANLSTKVMLIRR